MSVSSSSEFTDTTINDLLSGTTDSDWTNDKPDRIDVLKEYAIQEREAFNKPAVYIWEPTGADIDTLSADGNHLVEDYVIECVIQTLEDTLTKEYKRDVIQILTQYIDDNQTDTTFINITPVETEDLSNEVIPRQTDHYIASVQLDLKKYQPTR